MLQRSQASSGVDGFGFEAKGLGFKVRGLLEVSKVHASKVAIYFSSKQPWFDCV